MISLSLVLPFFLFTVLRGFRLQICGGSGGKWLPFWFGDAAQPQTWCSGVIFKPFIWCNGVIFNRSIVLHPVPTATNWLRIMPRRSTRQLLHWPGKFKNNATKYLTSSLTCGTILTMGLAMFPISRDGHSAFDWRTSSVFKIRSWLNELSDQAWPVESSVQTLNANLFEVFFTGHCFTINSNATII